MKTTIEELTDRLTEKGYHFKAHPCPNKECVLVMAEKDGAIYYDYMTPKPDWAEQEIEIAANVMIRGVESRKKTR